MDPNLGLARETPHLFSLPQEMLDMIFKLAYATVDDLRVISRKGWERKLESPKTSYHDRNFPVVKVQEFLVSKEYFVNAAKAFIANRTVCPSGFAEVYDIYDFAKQGIGRAWGRELRCSVYAVPRACMWSLKSLIVTLSEVFFVSCLQPGPAIWECEYGEADFRKLRSLGKLLNLRGLTHFSLIVTTGQHYIHTADDRLHWSRNVQRLDTLIRSQVLQPKAENTSTYRASGVHTSSALYPGSLVSSTGSKLLSASSISASRRLLDRRRESTSTLPSPGPPLACKLTTKDIPSSLEGLKSLLDTHGTAVMAWVREMKELAQR
ncbi:hypothetical protein LTR56_011351 [Elasticomyces elasticus]|nr:hypothetical protein LTR56_011351 [Elasticomyces elasticus]KAK3660953.1 hypothetical protein LTR22_007781 [Elasticomyces elasticus]KAK4932360.1 hypothetical protein LTR49_001229 [Elasticomyces elasticus]KAK5768368.1 hypothetical protein LTS12_001507 [Elasticomyces elasticus]